MLIPTVNIINTHSTRLMGEIPAPPFMTWSLVLVDLYTDLWGFNLENLLFAVVAQSRAGCWGDLRGGTKASQPGTYGWR